MKREDLEALGLASEAVDTVMALHGEDVERHRGAALDWQKRHEGDTAALQAALQQKDLRHAAAAAMAGLKFSSTSAKKAFGTALEQASLVCDGETLAGFEEFARQYRAEDPAAFAPEGAEKLPVLVKPADGTGFEMRSKDGALRRAFGL